MTSDLQAVDEQSLDFLGRPASFLEEARLDAQDFGDGPTPRCCGSSGASPRARSFELEMVNFPELSRPAGAPEEIVRAALYSRFVSRSLLMATKPMRRVTCLLRGNLCRLPRRAARRLPRPATFPLAQSIPS